MHTVNSFNSKLRSQSAAPLPLQLLPIQRPPSPRPAGDVASPTRVRAAPQISLVKFCQASDSIILLMQTCFRLGRDSSCYPSSGSSRAKTKWLKIGTVENLEIGGEVPAARPAQSPLRVASHVTRAEPDRFQAAAPAPPAPSPLRVARHVTRAEPELLRKSRPHQAWARDKEASKSLPPTSLTNIPHSSDPPPLASTTPQPDAIQPVSRYAPITAGRRRRPQTTLLDLWAPCGVEPLSENPQLSP